MSSIKHISKSYTRGAVIGGVIFGVFALVGKRRVFPLAVMGVLIGGFIAHHFPDEKAESVTKKTEFKNYDA